MRWKSINFLEELIEWRSCSGRVKLMTKLVMRCDVQIDLSQSRRKYLRKRVLNYTEIAQAFQNIEVAKNLRQTSRNLFKLVLMKLLKSSTKLSELDSSLILSLSDSFVG